VRVEKAKGILLFSSSLFSLFSSQREDKASKIAVGGENLNL
jgi:hypothetical protein